VSSDKSIYVVEVRKWWYLYSRVPVCLFICCGWSVAPRLEFKISTVKHRSKWRRSLEVVGMSKTTNLLKLHMYRYKF